MGEHWTSESQVDASSISCLKTITYIFAIPKYQKVIEAQFTVSYTNFFFQIEKGEVQRDSKTPISLRERLKPFFFISILGSDP